MEQRIVLVQAINLLYWASLLEVKTTDAQTLVQDVVTNMKLPESTLETDTNRDILIGLRSTVLNLCKTTETTPLDRITLLQRIRVNVKEDQGLYDALALSIEDSTDQVHIQKRYLQYTKEIYKLKREKELKDKIKKLLTEIVYSSIDDFNPRDVATKIITEMEPYSIDVNDKGVLGMRGVVGVIDFDSLDSILETLELAVKETSTEGIIRLGWQGINRMTGWHCGLRRGDEVVVGALQHNYKSGFTTNMTRHAFQYNKPFMLNPEKRPMILHISSENALTDNLMFMYQMLMENITKEPCDVSNVDRTVAAAWLQEKASEQGYSLRMIRVNPSEFGYRDLFNLILKYESEGFEIHMLTVDYLNMMSKEGCAMGPSGSDTRDLFRRVRNFCAP